DLAARTDDFTDLVDRDVHHFDARREFTELATAFGKGIGHLTEDVLAAALRLVERDLHDLFSDAGDLDIHLQRGDAVSGTCHLEVHIAEVIFVAEDVGADREAVAFEDQAHGDTGDGLCERNACVHQGERGAADGRHRGRTVRLGDLGNDAQRVGELLSRRQHRANGAPCELAVADFAAARGAHAAGFANRIGREVVMEQEALLVHAGQAVDILLVLAGTERRNDDRLGFTAREEGRTVGARQDADFRHDSANGLEIAAVDTALGVENVPADDLRLQVLEDGADDFGGILRLFAFGEEVCLDLGLDGVDGSVAISLLGDLVDFAQFDFEQLEHFGFEFGMVFRLEVARLLGGYFGELDDRVDDRLEALVAEHDGAEHDLFV